MWTAQIEELPNKQGLRFIISLDSHPATFAEVLAGWQNDADFRTWFNVLLAEAPYTAFRWEMPAMTTHTLSQRFEFVLLDSPGLNRVPDEQAFAEQFTDSQASVAVFPNLGGDAIMIVPCPLAELSAYGHLAAFVRLAPENQRHNFWQSVGTAMARRIGDKPVWLNTAGAGVSWLHVRLDSQPKYYRFEPYRQIPSS